MTYTDVFGGNLIFPSQVSYNRIDTAVDVVLQWPTEQQIEGVNVVADVIDVNTTVDALNIDMPDARNTSTGNKATFNNLGINMFNFTVRDATGGTIQEIEPGEQWVLVLTDNSTEAGSWTTFQLGGNAATNASASILAGDGLRADGPQLDQIIDSDVQASTPFSIVEGDRATCQIYTAGAGTCNISSGLANAFFFMLHNAGSGTLTVTPDSGTIDGSSSITIDPNGSSIIFTDGTNWFTVGLTVASTIAFDFVSIAVPGSGDFVLSGANLDRISYRFTGALTGNRRIVVPDTTQQYWVDNQTSGAFDLEVSTNLGSGQTIPQGESAIVYSDATDVINAVSSTSVTFPITIGQGGTSATNAADARTNLNAAFDGRLIDTAADSGLGGGGDLTADRALVLDVDNLITENSPDFATDTIAFYDDSAGAMRKTAIENVGAIEVQDEGAPLATRATTLNFVGAGVVASGGGATKTITIDTVEASAAAGRLLRGDGAGNWEDAGGNIEIDSIGRLITSQQLRIRAGASIGVDNTNQSLLSASATILSLSPFGSVTDFVFGLYDSIELNSSLKLFNFGSPTDADEAGYGQLYARSGGDISPELVWVDDGGDEYPVIEQGSFTIDFDVGFTGSNVVTIQYQRIGDVVHICMPSANFGNSNANTLGTGNDWPVALRPASTRYGQTTCTENSAEQVLGTFFLNSAGAITFLAPNGGDAGDYGSFWNASGVKGVNSGWSWTYRITDS